MEYFDQSIKKSGKYCTDSRTQLIQMPKGHTKRLVLSGCLYYSGSQNKRHRHDVKYKDSAYNLKEQNTVKCLSVT